MLCQILHGGDILSAVIPRFESAQASLEVIVVNTLREALSRRGGGGSGSSATTSASSGGSASLMAAAGGSGGTGEVNQLRYLIRTLAMAVGCAEVRGLVATRLEPWLTTVCVQSFRGSIVNFVEQRMFYEYLFFTCKAMLCTYTYYDYRL